MLVLIVQFTHPFPIICNNQFRLDLQALVGRWLRQPTNEEL